MAITEKRRNALHNDLTDSIGPESAETLMEMLPPTGWADVATKRDVDALAVATKSDVDALAVATKRDLDSLREWLEAKFESTVTQADLRQMIFAILAFNLALVGAVLGFG